MCVRGVDIILSTPVCFWLEQQRCVHCLLTVLCFSAAGTEFVRPVVGYFCSLCQLIYADEDEAKLQHCSSPAHYSKYQVLLTLILVFWGGGGGSSFWTIIIVCWEKNREGGQVNSCRLLLYSWVWSFLCCFAAADGQRSMGELSVWRWSNTLIIVWVFLNVTQKQSVLLEGSAAGWRYFSFQMLWTDVELLVSVRFTLKLLLCNFSMWSFIFYLKKLSNSTVGGFTEHMWWNWFI